MVVNVLHFELQGISTQAFFLLNVFEKETLVQIFKSNNRYISHLIFSNTKRDFYRITKKVFAKKVEFDCDANTWSRMFNENYISKTNDAIKIPTKTLLTKKESEILFIQYNYSRFMLCRLIERSQKYSLQIKEVREIISWHDKAKYINNILNVANLGLVFYMYKKFIKHGLHDDIQSILSEGTMTLHRCVERFDISKGNVFSTYACNGIFKSMIRESKKQKKKIVTNHYSYQDTIIKDPYISYDEDISLPRIHELRDILTYNRAKLTEMESWVINRRFMHKDILGDTGRYVGLTKERIRQIQKKALEKLSDCFVD